MKNGDNVTPENVASLPPGSVVRSESSFLIRLHDDVWVYISAMGWKFDVILYLQQKLNDTSTLIHMGQTPAALPTVQTVRKPDGASALAGDGVWAAPVMEQVSLDVFRQVTKMYEERIERLEAELGHAKNVIANFGQLLEKVRGMLVAYDDSLRTIMNVINVDQSKLETLVRAFRPKLAEAIMKLSEPYDR